MSTAQTQLDPVRLAMQKTNELFATEVVGNRNYDALDLVYTSEARILPPGAPMISGRAAIKDFWKRLIEGTNATGGSLSSVDVMPAGDGVIEIGSAVLTMQPAGQNEPSQLEVKYVVCWLQEEGAWKWNIDVWNTNA